MEFGRLSQILDESGNVKYRQIYVTKEPGLKKGDKIYLNEIEDSLANKVKYGLITEDEKVQRLAKIAEDDAKFNRITTHVLKKAKASTQEG